MLRIGGTLRLSHSRGRGLERVLLQARAKKVQMYMIKRKVETGVPL